MAPVLLNVFYIVEKVFFCKFKGIK